MKTLNYFKITVTYSQDQTIGNCIDLGFGTEKIKSILTDMIENNIDYLNKKELNKLR